MPIRADDPQLRQRIEHALVLSMVRARVMQHDAPGMRKRFTVLAVDDPKPSTPRNEL
jgi:hypothetical protein